MGIHHRERYDADFDKLQPLHFSAFRFSVEWARSNPNRVYITSKKLLFLGMNWYNDDSYDGFAVKKPNEKVNDMGWDMRPIRIEETLVRLYNRYQLPILITENGLALVLAIGNQLVNYMSLYLCATIIAVTGAGVIMTIKKLR